MEGTAILGFEWILLFAAIAGVISVWLRLPPVAGLLVAGMLIGPNVLGMVDTPTISAFAEIGAVLLLFMIGVEFSITKLLSTGLRAVISSLLLMLITFTLMHEIAILFGFDSLSSLFIASMFAMSSTAIMMKILEQKELVGRPETTVLVTMLIIEDVVAVFLLTFFSTLKSGSYDLEGLIGAVFLSLCILAFGYVILLGLLKKFSLVFLRYQAEDTLILFSFALGIGMSAVASLLGLTPAIGAFLAGSIIAGLPNGRDFEHAIRPFGQVFSSFFFLSVGMLINPFVLTASAGPALGLILSFMAVIFLATAFAFYLISSSGRSSVFAGLAFLPLGEFSLLIAKESVGIVSADLVGIASLGVLITSVFCSVLVAWSDRLYLWLKSTLPKGFQDTLKDASGYFRNVISAFEPEGYFHKLFISETRLLATDIMYLLAALLFFWFGRQHLQFQVVLGGHVFRAESLLLFVLILVSLIPIFKLLLSVKRLFDALAMIFSRSTPQANKGVILRNVLIAVLCFAIFANYYLAVDFLLLPHAFNWLSIVFGALSLFFMWSALRASSLWFFLGERKVVNIMHPRVTASKEDVIVLSEANAELPMVGKTPRKKKKVMFLR